MSTAFINCTSNDTVSVRDLAASLAATGQASCLVVVPAQHSFGQAASTIVTYGEEETWETLITQLESYKSGWQTVVFVARPGYTSVPTAMVNLLERLAADQASIWIITGPAMPVEGAPVEDEVAE